MTNAPTTLYILGNGFDLWHGIPSKYSDFRTYVEANDSDLFREMENYIPIDDWWSNLEASLADIDVDHLVESNQIYLSSYGSDDWSDSAHHDFQYEVQKTVKRLSMGLTERIAQWIRSVDVKRAGPRRLHKIDVNATFLTFNYTDTLSVLYNVPDLNVLHIHGRADKLNEDLVLGHAWNPVSRPSLNEIPDIEDLDTRLYEANEIIDGYFSSTFKPTDEIIKMNESFFKNINVQKIYVLGHSLSDVDAGYFQALLANHSCRAAEWNVACLEGEADAKEESLVQLGVSRDKVVLAPWSAFY